MLYNVVLVSAVEQSESAICIYISPLSWASLPHPLIPPLQVITEHRAELPVLYSSFPLAIYVTHGSVYMSVLLSQFIHPSLLPLSTSPFSTSASLFLQGDFKMTVNSPVRYNNIYLYLTNNRPSKYIK